MLLFFKCERRHTKRGEILVCQKPIGNSNKMNKHTFSLTTKDCRHYPYWQIPKHVHKKNNDSHIYFLCIGCNPQHCGSVFYAWVTARKQSLLVLSMHAAQKERKSFRASWDRKTRIWLGGEKEVGATSGVGDNNSLTQATDITLFVFIDLLEWPS